MENTYNQDLQLEAKRRVELAEAQIDILDSLCWDQKMNLQDIRTRISGIFDSGQRDMEISKISVFANIAKAKQGIIQKEIEQLEENIKHIKSILWNLQ